MIGRDQFRSELSRLYADATQKGYHSDDLAGWAKVTRPVMVRWLGGYSWPASSEAAEAALVAIQKGLDS